MMMMTYLIDVLGETFWHRTGFHKQSIVFVARLRKAQSVRLFTHSFAIRDDRVRDLQRDTGMIFLEILETDLKMQLTGSSNNMLTRFFNWTLNITNNISAIFILCNTINKFKLLLLLLLLILLLNWVTWKDETILRLNFGPRPKMHKFIKWQQAFCIYTKVWFIIFV